MWTQLLLEFTSDVHQTFNLYSPKHKDDQWKKGSRSGVIQGSFWAKNLEKITILSLSGYLLLEFKLDRLQTCYVYSSKHKDAPRKKGSRSGVIWAKNLEKIANLSLSSYLLLQFMSDLLQTWYVYSLKFKDAPRKKGSRSGVILG